jgi:hypothetical protein
VKHIYAGRWLRVNLGSGEIAEETASEQDVQTWLLGTRICSYWRGYGVEWPGWQEGPRDRFASDEATVRLVIAFQVFLPCTILWACASS